jgi:Xaa-Pro aminopeptidase
VHAPRVDDDTVEIVEPTTGAVPSAARSVASAGCEDTASGSELPVTLLESVAVDRLTRLRATMRAASVPVVITADPIDIFYATGVRNMTLFSMMGASRFVAVFVDGPVIVWEFAGSEHLATNVTTVDEVRTARGVTALGGSRYRSAVDDFAAEIAGLCAEHGADIVGIEGFDYVITDALRANGLTLCSATEVFVESRRIKLPGEIEVMRDGTRRVTDAVAHMIEHLRAGATEIEVWSHFHQRLIASDGEYVSTRLVQAGERTFPYFQEAGPHPISLGDLFCIDTDAIAYGGYGVDFSRCYSVGAEPSADQRSLHAKALDQLEHNADLLKPGVSFSEFARSAWVMPARHAPWGYYCLAHGLGLCGEYPYVPLARAGDTYDLDGEFEPGMVICIESYIGDETLRQGVKLEDQYLITDDGTERLTTAPFDPTLSTI